MVHLPAVPPLLSWGDPPGQPLVRTFGVVDLIEPVDLFLQLLEGLGQGLLVKEAE